MPCRLHHPARLPKEDRTILPGYMRKKHPTYAQSRRQYSLPRPCASAPITCGLTSRTCSICKPQRRVRTGNVRATRNDNHRVWTRAQRNSISERERQGHPAPAVDAARSPWARQTRTPHGKTHASENALSYSGAKQTRGDADRARGGKGGSRTDEQQHPRRAATLVNSPSSPREARP